MFDDDSEATPPIDRSISWAPRILGILFLVGAGGMVLGFWGHYRVAAKGPKPMTAAQLAAADSLDELPNKWVVFQPDQIVNTDVSVVEGTRFKKHYYYHLVRVGDRWAVVRAQSRVIGGRITAAAEVFESEQEQLGVTEAQRHKSKARFLPYQFDTVGTPAHTVRVGGTITLMLLMAGAALTCGLLDQRKPKVEPDDLYAEPTTTGWQWGSR